MSLPPHVVDDTNDRCRDRHSQSVLKKKSNHFSKRYRGLLQAYCFFISNLSCIVTLVSISVFLKAHTYTIFKPKLYFLLHLCQSENGFTCRKINHSCEYFLKNREPERVTSEKNHLCSRNLSLCPVDLSTSIVHNLAKCPDIKNNYLHSGKAIDTRSAAAPN